MGKSLVLVSHGNFSHELKKSAEMIMGEQENIYSVALLPSEGQEDFKAKLLETIEPLDEVVVFADLMGGTPANVVTKLILEGQSIPLYAGMNLPMVIGFINGEMIQEEVDYVQFGIDNIKDVAALLIEDDEDDE